MCEEDTGFRSSLLVLVSVPCTPVSHGRLTLNLSLLCSTFILHLVPKTLENVMIKL